MAMRFARYFCTTPEFWLGLQQDYALDLARDTAAAKIEREVFPQRQLTTRCSRTPAVWPSGAKPILCLTSLSRDLPLGELWWSPKK